jgi:hypothetical protein
MGSVIRYTAEAPHGGGHAKVYGYDVSSTLVDCGSDANQRWIGVFDGQQMQGDFKHPQEAFFFVSWCLVKGYHPAKQRRSTGDFFGDLFWDMVMEVGAELEQVG